MSRRVAIVGAGRVGSSAAYALQLGRGCDELVLVDALAELAEGEALDLTHGRAAAGGPRILAGGYERLAGADLVVVTAGARRQPQESRLALIARNAALFRGVLADLKQVGLHRQAVLLVVTNPVDVLTYLATAEMGWPAERAIGLGTVLDTLRFRSLIGEGLRLEPTRLEALIVGEHGDSMVPVASALRYDGAPLSAAPGYSQAAVEEAFAATRTAGAAVIRLKGGAGHAVGLAVRQVVEALLDEGGALLPVSTVLAGREVAPESPGVALSLPTRVRRGGAAGVVMPDMTEEEHRRLVHSAQVLRQTLERLARGTEEESQ